MKKSQKPFGLESYSDADVHFINPVIHQYCHKSLSAWSPIRTAVDNIFSLSIFYKSFWRGIFFIHRLS